MAGNFPFTPSPGFSIGFTAGTSSQSRQVKQSDIGLNYWPSQVRLFNTGTVLVWIYFAAQPTAITIPIPGTNTVGTPGQCVPLVPGILEVFSLSNFQLANLWISDISTATSQNYYLTFGEGL